MLAKIFNFYLQDFNCSSPSRKWGSVDTWNDSRAWKRRLQGKMLKIRVKNGMKRRVGDSPISTEDYLRNEMSKANTIQTGDKCNKVIDHFDHLKTYEHSKEMETKWKNTVPRIIQLCKHTQMQSTLRQ